MGMASIAEAIRLQLERRSRWVAEIFVPAYSLQQSAEGPGQRRGEGTGGERACGGLARMHADGGKGIPEPVQRIVDNAVWGSLLLRLTSALRVQDEVEGAAGGDTGTSHAAAAAASAAASRCRPQPSPSAMSRSALHHARIAHTPNFAAGSGGEPAVEKDGDGGEDVTMADADDDDDKAKKDDGEAEGAGGKDAATSIGGNDAEEAMAAEVIDTSLLLSPSDPVHLTLS